MLLTVTSPAVIAVGYELETYTTSEGEGSLELTITLFNFSTDGTPQPFFLSVSTEDGSAGMKFSIGIFVYFLLKCSCFW